MHVASLELCKELYELSGWDDTDYTYYINAGEYSGQVCHRSEVFDKDGNMPAYDIGYLLRKLPDEATSEKHGGYHYFYMHHNSQYWYAYYGVIDTTEFMEYADTPEDAAAKLAIELFKQKILSKED